MRSSPWLLFALLLAAGAADASWIREYDRGLQAVRQEDWAEAERRFAAALREDGTPQERRRFQGTVFRPYVPHYYAGLAAYRRGDCQQAMQYWSHAPTASVLSQLEEEQAEYRRGVAACQTRLAQATQPKPASSAPAPAQPSSAAPAVAVAQPSTAPARPPASTSTPAVRPSSTPAARPATPVAATPTPKPAAARPAAAARSAPAALRSAVDAYLSGRYPELLRIDAASAGDGRDRAQVHLFRAAAAFVLAEQAGKAEGSALDNARREVRAARAAQAALQPDEVMFSPRFRRFWQQTR